MDIIYPDEAYRIMGACFEVYKEMGCGFLEAVYQECLVIEFMTQAVPFSSEQMLDLTYKGVPLKQKYIPDFIAYGKIVLEIKAVKDLAPEHHAQLHNYLKAMGYRLGLLMNFGHQPKLEYKRIVR